MSEQAGATDRLKLGARAQRERQPRPDFDNDQIEKVYARWAPFYDPAFAQIMRWGRAAAVACANRHHDGQILDVGVGLHSDRRTPGEIAGPNGSRITAIGDAGHHDVPIGEHACQLVVGPADR